MDVREVKPITPQEVEEARKYEAYFKFTKK